MTAVTRTLHSLRQGQLVRPIATASSNTRKSSSQLSSPAQPIPVHVVTVSTLLIYVDSDYAFCPAVIVARVMVFGGCNRGQFEEGACGGGAWSAWATE